MSGVLPAGVYSLAIQATGSTCRRRFTQSFSFELLPIACSQSRCSVTHGALHAACLAKTSSKYTEWTSVKEKSLYKFAVTPYSCWYHWKCLAYRLKPNRMVPMCWIYSEIVVQNVACYDHNGNLIQYWLLTLIPNKLQCNNPISKNKTFTRS